MALPLERRMALLPNLGELNLKDVFPMNISKKIQLYERFNEGTELEDAVKKLLQAASILNGISADHELSLVMLVVEKLIRDYMAEARNRNVEWEEYEEIDPELYSFMLGGAQKLTRAQYESGGE